MDIEDLKLATDCYNTMIDDCMKNMNFLQRLKFKTQIKLSDIWIKILLKTKYRKIIKKEKCKQ